MQRENLPNSRPTAAENRWCLKPSKLFLCQPTQLQERNRSACRRSAIWYACAPGGGSSRRSQIPAGRAIRQLCA